MKLTQFYMTAFAVLAYPAAAQVAEPEEFHVEVTAGIRVVSARGTIQSGVSPVDLERDLAIRRNRPLFAGSLVFKPARRHRILTEGATYRLSGDNPNVGQFTFAGQTYAVDASSEADIPYGYQYDLVGNPRGHFGLQGGLAYVDATGTVRSQTLGFTGSLTESFPFPVAGALLNLNGGIKGMTLGDYGHFVEGAIHGGVGLGRHLTLQAGYRATDADVHRRDHIRGFAPRFTGPVFSLQVRL
jgi:hypothetical protein